MLNAPGAKMTPKLPSDWLSLVPLGLLLKKSGFLQGYLAMVLH